MHWLKARCRLSSHWLTKRNIITNRRLCGMTCTLARYSSLALYKSNSKLEAKDVLPNINCTQAAKRDKKCHFLSLVTLAFDLDLQTQPSEGPNTSSMWMWRKSIQRFPWYFIHKTKKTGWRHQKQNLLQFTACGKNWVHPTQRLTNTQLYIPVRSEMTANTNEMSRIRNKHSNADDYGKETATYLSHT